MTLTNNCPSIIAFFHHALLEVITPKYKPRISVYLPTVGFPFSHPVRHCRYRSYIDTRANRPYYIYRVSGVATLQKWRTTVFQASRSASNYKRILQGFFAGEGNVKEGAHHNRALRIAQGERNPLLEEILSRFGVGYTYGGHREYTITGRRNLEYLLSLGIAALHPEKKARFLKMMASYRQWHHPRNAFSALVYSQLSSPKTTKELAARLRRSESRVRQTLAALKSDGRVHMFHVNSVFYWTMSDSHTIVISKQKRRILALLGTPLRVYQVASKTGRGQKAVTRRLEELERLGLVESKKPFWTRKSTSSVVMVR